MSKRSERREADRLARKAAYQLRLQPKPADEPEPQSAPSPELTTQPAVAPAVTVEPTETDLLARAQAFFDRPASNGVSAQITPAQLQANRANAQLSTGPITPEGKAVSARNNTRHGLATESDPSAFKVLPTENQDAYNQSLAGFQKEWKPNTATEHDLVNRLAMHQWLRLRAIRLQDTLFSHDTGELTDTKKFELYRRYETTHERAFNRAFSDLLRLRSFQLRERNGFESQKRKNEEHEFKMQRLRNQDELKKAALQLKLDRRKQQTFQQAA